MQKRRYNDVHDDQKLGHNVIQIDNVDLSLNGSRKQKVRVVKKSDINYKPSLVQKELLIKNRKIFNKAICLKKNFIGRPERSQSDAGGMLNIWIGMQRKSEGGLGVGEEKLISMLY